MGRHARGVDGKVAMTWRDRAELAAVLLHHHGGSGQALPSNASALPDNHLHWVREGTFDEGRSQNPSGSGPRAMASLRHPVICILRVDSTSNIVKHCDLTHGTPPAHHSPYKLL
jgi:hypothetical protein